MATFNYLHKIVPEVNFWVNRTLYNNSFNNSFVQCPTKISDFWRSRDSVVELLFNETADPSGNTYDDGYHFIWKYRTINIGKLYFYEPMLFRRIQVYYNSSWVYAAKDDEKYKDIMNLNMSEIERQEIPEDLDYPYGVKPSKYVNYNSHIVASGTDQLHYDDPPFDPESEPDPDIIIYREEENVFGLTEEELNMCEYLYYYRTGQYELIEPFEDDYYYTLQSPLSKWVYNYLMCYLFNIVNFNYLKTITDESDGYFRCLVEKHMQDRIYEYIQKHNLALWENVRQTHITHEDKRSFVTYTMKNNTYIQKGRISENDIIASCIFLTDIDKNPETYNNFEFILDGKILKHGIDYKIENISSETSKKIRIVIINKDLELTSGQKYQFMYNYIVVKTPISGMIDIDNN